MPKQPQEIANREMEAQRRALEPIIAQVVRDQFPFLEGHISPHDFDIFLLGQMEWRPAIDQTSYYRFETDIPQSFQPLFKGEERHFDTYAALTFYFVRSIAYCNALLRTLEEKDARQKTIEIKQRILKTAARIQIGLDDNNLDPDDWAYYQKQMRSHVQELVKHPGAKEWMETFKQGHPIESLPSDIQFLFKEFMDQRGRLIKACMSVHRNDLDQHIKGSGSIRSVVTRHLEYCYALLTESLPDGKVFSASPEKIKKAKSDLKKSKKSELYDQLYETAHELYFYALYIMPTFTEVNVRDQKVVLEFAQSIISHFTELLAKEATVATTCEMIADLLDKKS